MGRAELLQGVRRMRFEALLARHESGELSQAEAGEMLGVSGSDGARSAENIRGQRLTLRQLSYETCSPAARPAGRSPGFLRFSGVAC